MKRAQGRTIVGGSQEKISETRKKFSNFHGIRSPEGDCYRENQDAINYKY